MGMHKSASAQCKVSAFAKFVCASVYNCDLLPTQTQAGGFPAAILLTTFFLLSCRSIFCL